MGRRDEAKLCIRITHAEYDGISDVAKTEKKSMTSYLVDLHNENEKKYRKIVEIDTELNEFAESLGNYFNESIADVEGSMSEQEEGTPFAPIYKDILEDIFAKTVTDIDFLSKLYKKHIVKNE